LREDLFLGRIALFLPQICLEVDPIVWTKIDRSIATPCPALLAVTLFTSCFRSYLPLLAGRPCGTSLPPGETEAGSAGEQPDQGITRPTVRQWASPAGPLPFQVQGASFFSPIGHRSYALKTPSTFTSAAHRFCLPSLRPPVASAHIPRPGSGSPGTGAAAPRCRRGSRSADRYAGPAPPHSPWDRCPHI
jgi:hypothetical protein